MIGVVAVKAKIVASAEQYQHLPIKKDTHKSAYLQQFELICRVIYGTSFNPEYNVLKQKLFSDILNKTSNFYIGKQSNRQVLIDVSLLVMALLNTPSNLDLITAAQLDILNQELLVIYKNVQPMLNNWLLFKSIIEVWLYQQGYIQQLNFTQYVLDQVDKWYQFDGSYLDGDNSKKNYYSSIVFHPYLLTISEQLNQSVSHYINRYQIYIKTLRQDFDISGSFIQYGRSLNYRVGCFHAMSYGIAKGIIDTPASDAYDQFLDCYLQHNDLFINNSHFLNFDGNFLIEEYMNYGSLYMVLAGLLHVGNKQ